MTGRSYSDETKTAAVEALRDGEEIAEVAARFDIPRRTVQGWWRWQEKYELSRKHRAFVNAYFKMNMNGTRAYMEVYGVDEETAAANASRLLRNAKVDEVVQDRLRRKAMGLDEVLARLGEQARGEGADYLDEKGNLDVAALVRDGKGHLVKKIRQTRYGKSYEIYDSQSALNILLKHLTGRADVQINVVMKLQDALESGRVTPDQIRRRWPNLADKLFREAGVKIGSGH